VTRVTSRRLRFQQPSFPSAAAIERYLAAARDERWFSNSGPCWRLLRDRLAASTSCECVPVANATLGLIVAIAALRPRGPGRAHQALVPSFAFAASAQAAVWNGLAPVFVDIDPEHWHVAPAALESALARRRGEIAVVIALSSFGTPPPPQVRERWEETCSTAGVPLVVDSAAGFGASAADGRPIGSQGDAEVVSFHAVKPLAAGEGGAVFTRDPDLAAEVLSLTGFALDERKSATRRDGINAKMSEHTAAVSLAALDEFPAALAARRAAAAQILAELPEGFRPQAEHERSTWQFVPVSAPSAETRDQVLAAAGEGLELRTYYDPLHRMPAFEECGRADDLTATRELSGRILSLPMATDLQPDEIAAIGASLRAAVDRS
jgi:dTDP-4-amino-4,6-dideoxygalactose transaminase